MTRHFLRLYLAVLLPLLLLIMLPVSPITPLVDRWAEALVEEQYRGTYFLLERQLEPLPQSDWPERIAQQAQRFGRELKLARLDSVEISEAERQALQQRGHVYNRDGDPHAWRRIGDSDYALYLGFGESRREKGHREAVGTAMLIRDYLADYRDIDEGLRRLAPHFGFPLAIRHASQLELDAAQRRLLEQGKIVRVSVENGCDYYYGALDRGGQVLVAGPLDDHALNERIKIAFAMMPALLLALAVLFWLRPLWRDLKRLKATAAGFGDGDLSARSALQKGSTLHLLAATFNGMADSIQRLVVGQKELAHAVSHEFKTPVARLRFALEMLRGRPQEGDRERYLDSMESDLEELEKLIGELLNHARYDRPDLALHLEPVALAGWLERRAADHRRGNPGLDITVEADEVTGPVEIDPQAMAKLINNLLCNALRHARSQVRVTATREGEKIVVSVEDDGPGVPETEREAIFNPFYRLDSSRARNAGGSGLGLAIVQRIAERHGGSVACDQSPLGGARFRVSWPSTQR